MADENEVVDATTEETDTSCMDGKKTSLRDSFKKLRGGSKKKQRKSMGSTASSAEITSVASSSVLASPVNEEPQSELSGWLCKWTNYILRNKKFWFVLANGTLSYYNNQAEMQYPPRGSISLNGATIQIAKGNEFVVTNESCTQIFYLRAANQAEKQCWITALEWTRAQNIKAEAGEVPKSESVDDGFESSDNEASRAATKKKESAIKIVTNKVKEISATSSLLSQQGSALVQLLKTLKEEKALGNSTSEETAVLNQHINTVNERAALLKLTSGAMVKAASDFLAFFQQEQGLIENEKELKLKFEAMVEQFVEHDFSPQEQSCKACQQRENLSIISPPGLGSITDIKNEVKGVNESQEKIENKALFSIGQDEQKKVVRQRRERIPDKPNIQMSVRSLMKNSNSKDITKMSVPVNFSEPLSMLQRITESDMEYAELLHRAAKIDDDCEQMAYVTAFTVSAYSTTATRSTKPFTPLLGETFECDRSDDKGWRSLMEQVCHQPPTLAQFVESSNGEWQCWQEFSMQTKFKGHYMELVPLGIAHLVFPNSGNHYTWRKVTTVVHNIVIGKLWVDQVGEMDITNHSKNIICHLKFDAYSRASGTHKKVSGTVTNAKNEAELIVSGTWDKQFDVARVRKEPYVKGKTFLKVEDFWNLWSTNYPRPGSEKYYNFTVFACEMNEPEDGVAPTDSRLRPDLRLMENGEWDQSSLEKIRLEEKQRAACKKREEVSQKALKEGQNPEPYQPTWFTPKIDHMNDSKQVHMYHGGYWEAKKKKNWDVCPDIY